MAGSPKKRARKEARERAAAAAGALPRTADPVPLAPAGGLTATELDRDLRDASPAQSPPAVVFPEVLPPAPADVTGTAMKRAMRRKAQEYADEAIQVIAAAMAHTDPRIAVPAAREILDRAHGKPTPDIEIGDGSGLQIAIIRFGDA